MAMSMTSSRVSLWSLRHSAVEPEVIDGICRRSSYFSNGGTNKTPRCTKFRCRLRDIGAPHGPKALFLWMIWRNFNLRSHSKPKDVAAASAAAVRVPCASAASNLHLRLWNRTIWWQTIRITWSAQCSSILAMCFSPSPRTYSQSPLQGTPLQWNFRYNEAFPILRQLTIFPGPICFNEIFAKEKFEFFLYWVMKTQNHCEHMQRVTAVLSLLSFMENSPRCHSTTSLPLLWRVPLFDGDYNDDVAKINK